MAFNRLGRRLEDGIAAFITARKRTMLSGVSIVTQAQAGAVNEPYLAIYSAMSQPWSDPDRRGSMYGPRRSTVRMILAEHMNGTSRDQFAGELTDIISRAQMIGTVVSPTTASAVFRLTYLLRDDPAPAPGDLLRIAGGEYEIASVAAVPLPVLSQYEITLTTTASFASGTPVFFETPEKKGDEFGDVIEWLNSDGFIKVWRFAFVSEVANVAGDLRLLEFEFEVDALNSPDLTT
jgi:hypothetical protein